MESQKLQHFFQQEWQRYCALTPQAQEIKDLLQKKGEEVQNDHIAFRTFAHPLVGLEVLTQEMKSLGYEPRGEYHFKVKKLYAKHFECLAHPHYPKIFISELLCDQLDPETQETISQFLNASKEEISAAPSKVQLGRPWKISHTQYLKLAAESEYAAWLYAFGIVPNHFTVNVNKLNHFGNLQQLNAFLEKEGFKMNTAGGAIKGSPADYLEQSSTMAAYVDWDFSEGTYQVPSCYYEFAKRYPLDSGALYQGFVAKSADKIFESTDRHL